MHTKLPAPGAQHSPRRDQKRAGNIVVLSAAAIVMIFGFAAFTIDVGYISLTKAQLQAAADASALSAAIELPPALGLGPTRTSAKAETIARTSAADVAARHRAGDVPSIYVDTQRDVRFGQRLWDEGAGTYVESWGTAPYNLVEVTLRRNQGAGAADGPLPLFFAPVIGHDDASLEVRAAATLGVGVGFKIPPGSQQRIDVLPFALDVPTWENLLNGIGTDDYTYNPETGKVTNGPDGILEVNLYPNGSGSLPPGNRGTVDLGDRNNSTNDIARQILHGLNAHDLSFFGGEIRTDQGPLYINGDTGISAGIKDELEAIKGQPRLIPLFTAVSGPGNNATYTIVKFVGIRVMNVRLTGSASSKHVMVQPAPFVAPTVIRGNAPLAVDAYFSPVQLLR